MESRPRWQYWLTAGLVGLLILAATILAVMPPLVDFGVAVALAVGWCIWLDQRPTRQAPQRQRRKEPGR